MLHTVAWRDNQTCRWRNEDVYSNIPCLSVSDWKAITPVCWTLPAKSDQPVSKVKAIYPEAWNPSPILTVSFFPRTSLLCMPSFRHWYLPFDTVSTVLSLFSIWWHPPNSHPPSDRTHPVTELARRGVSGREQILVRAQLPVLRRQRSIKYLEKRNME